MIEYTEALRAARIGCKIKRECWETWLSIQGGRLHFQLSPKLAEELGIEFEPHPTDLLATDWVADA